MDSVPTEPGGSGGLRGRALPHTRRRYRRRPEDHQGTAHTGLAGRARPAGPGAPNASAGAPEDLGCCSAAATKVARWFSFWRATSSSPQWLRMGARWCWRLPAPSTIFGELAVLNGSPRRADATTLTACSVMAIDGTLFRRLVGRSPEAMFAAIRLLSERLSAITEQGMDAVSLPAPVRLAKALLHLAGLHSQRVDGCLHIGFRLSQRELGAMTGLIARASTST